MIRMIGLSIAATIGVLAAFVLAAVGLLGFFVLVLL